MYYGYTDKVITPNSHLHDAKQGDLKFVQMLESGKPLYLLRHKISIAKIMGYAGDLRKMFNDACSFKKLS